MNAFLLQYLPIVIMIGLAAAIGVGFLIAAARPIMITMGRYCRRKAFMKASAPGIARVLA